MNPGERHNCFVILDEIQRTDEDRMFLVDCDCGNTHVMPGRSVRNRLSCPLEGNSPRTGSSARDSLTAFPGSLRKVKESKVYQLWASINREDDAPVCKEWKNFPRFVRDFAELMGGSPYDYLKPRIQWSYYTMERINKEGIWEKDNVTVRKFFSERAYHTRSYLYWRLLGERGLLEEDLEKDYIQFINTFGEKQTGYVLKRRNRRQLHSRDNSEWVKNGRVGNEGRTKSTT